MGNARSILISGSSFSSPWEELNQSKGSWEKVSVVIRLRRRPEIIEKIWNRWEEKGLRRNGAYCGGLELVRGARMEPWISVYFFIKDLCLFKLVTMDLYLFKLRIHKKEMSSPSSSVGVTRRHLRSWALPRRRFLARPQERQLEIGACRLSHSIPFFQCLSGHWRFTRDWKKEFLLFDLVKIKERCGWIEKCII